MLADPSGNIPGLMDQALFSDAKSRRSSSVVSANAAQKTKMLLGPYQAPVDTPGVLLQAAVLAMRSGLTGSLSGVFTMMARPLILIAAPPFSGHLHPLLGLGRYLQTDYRVLIACTTRGRADIEATGLEGIFLLEGQDDAIDQIVNPPHQIRHNPILLYGQLKANVRLMAQMQRELQAIFAELKPAALVADFTLAIAGLTAEQDHIPWLTTLPSPCVYECPQGPVAYFGGLRPRSDRIGRIRDALHRSLLRLFKRSMATLCRRDLRRIGFRSIYRSDGSERVYSPKRVYALGMRELEFERGCPDRLQLIGPILYTPPDHWPAPRFRQQQKHVLVTLGTHLLFAKQGLLQAMLQLAARYSGYDFHFSFGASQGAKSELLNLQNEADNVQIHAFISYARHLHHYDVAIHHAGSGILYACLQKAIPALVIPMDYDQFDNAVRLEAVGAAHIAPRIADLQPAWQRLIDDPEIKAKCQLLQQQLQLYQPCHTIATELEALLAGRYS
ncbi:MAG: hypothetical protein KDK39_06515 [Leptospiraceae bacterium]|nr:hypothetical protein [Leptospiraceae bacterium]